MYIFYSLFVLNGIIMQKAVLLSHCFYSLFCHVHQYFKLSHLSGALKASFPWGSELQ